MAGAEDMRRDGYEFSVSPPKVVMRCAINARLPLATYRQDSGPRLPGYSTAHGQGFGGCRQEGKERLEPIEEVICEVADEFSGAVIEALTVRKGEVSRIARVLPPNLVLWYSTEQRVERRPVRNEGCTSMRSSSMSELEKQE